ncbi:unnamed protein product [Gongylonema pulchrum]|uniref:CID domain-containing protein n=1 Tax=Gongylonema pulchrum TaxID=637853 RepID=A0A183EVQ4_9BILA|nr:unnamed protein product [Gongylonema pulchrum]
MVSDEGDGRASAVPTGWREEMSDVTIDEVYDACERLDRSNQKNTMDYKIFIAGTRSDEAKVKKLCAQMIVRYWQHFTDLRNMAFYSLVSLLEDRDPEVSRHWLGEFSILFEAPAEAK